jgi:hypothetical protein
MAIARFEQITVNNLAFAKSDFGEQSTAQTVWFRTRARVQSVANSVKISEKYRLYQDVVNFILNYTPNTREMVRNQNLYSISYNGYDWRIDNVRRSNDRMTVVILAYRTDPITAV